MSREEKLREIADQEQALMREVYGFDAGVNWAETRIIEILKRIGSRIIIWDGTDQVGDVDTIIEFIKGKAE